MNVSISHLVKVCFSLWFPSVSLRSGLRLDTKWCNKCSNHLSAYSMKPLSTSPVSVRPGDLPVSICGSSLDRAVPVPLTSVEELVSVGLLSLHGSDLQVLPPSRRITQHINHTLIHLYRLASSFNII